MRSFASSAAALAPEHLGENFRDGSASISQSHQSTQRDETSAEAWLPTPFYLHELEEASNLVIYSEVIEDALNRIALLEDNAAPVLITGETGTGKELFARALHAAGPRSSGPFVPFNCAAISQELAESQLFGHRRGSFTGAMSDHLGVIRAAEGGALFLDEVGELGLDLQPKLLRFLQEGEVHPVGEAQPIKVHVRVIAATNRNLAGEARSGIFRADLFYRLNIILFHLPPLREHPDKIEPLIAYYLDLYRHEVGKPDLQLGQETVELLCSYDWPGNVRELCAELQRLTLWAQAGEVVTADQLSPYIRNRPAREAAPPPLEGRILIDENQSYAAARDQLAREMFARALDRCGGNITRAAQELGLDRTGLGKAIKRLGIRL